MGYQRPVQPTSGIRILIPTVSITAPPDDGPELARSLVEEELAACVNILDCQSFYRWDGEIHDDEELLLLAKTTDERSLLSDLASETPE